MVSIPARLALRRGEQGDNRLSRDCRQHALLFRVYGAETGGRKRRQAVQRSQTARTVNEGCMGLRVIIIISCKR